MNDIKLRGPAGIWCRDAAPVKEELDAIRPGGHVQSGVKSAHGIDSVWIRVHAINRNSLDGVIIDGPGRGQSIRFRRRDVWQVL